MPSKRTRLIIAGIATTFALVAILAPFTFWRTPDNVARASAPDYAEAPPRLRARDTVSSRLSSWWPTTPEPSPPTSSCPTAC